MIYGLLAASLIILLLLPTFAGPWIQGIFIMIFYYAHLGQSWNILTGYAGQISLGHAAFAGIGAYTSTKLFLAFGLSPWLGMLLGGLLATAAGLFVGFLGFRFGVRGVYFAILTLAFAEILRLIVLHLDVLGRSYGLFVPFGGHNPVNFQFAGKSAYYYISLALMLLSSAVVWLIARSKLGYYVVSIREDEDAAESLGVNAFRYKLIAISISAFLTALGGSFYAQYFLYIHPDINIGVPLSIEIILRPIVGGMGTVLGPLLGSFLLTPLGEFSRSYLAEHGYVGLHLVIYGALMVAVVMFLPRGIISFLERRFVRLAYVSVGKSPL